MSAPEWTLTLTGPDGSRTTITAPTQREVLDAIAAIRREPVVYPP